MDISIHDDIRVIWVRRAIIFFFLMGIFLSFKLWVSDRLFPLLPVFDIVPTSVFPYDYILVFSLILLLGINLFSWKNMVNIFALLILLILFLQDQNRWQPWVYIYFIFLIIFSLPAKKAGDKNYPLFYFRLIIIGIYLWSGIQKLNTNFIDGTFESILTRLIGIQDRQLIENFKVLGYFIPAVEIVTAVLLFLPKWRNIGVYAATLTHIFILIYLSPLGINNNSIVYPWNAAMIFIVFILFYRTTEKMNLSNLYRFDTGTILIIFSIYLFPFLNFFGWWDNYLSFSFYSNKVDTYFVVIAENELYKVDSRLSQYYLHVEGLEGGQIIDVGKWSEKELNVPFYPERRTFKKVANSFCRLGIKDDQLYFLELSSLEKGKYARYTCKDL